MAAGAPRRMLAAMVVAPLLAALALAAPPVALSGADNGRAVRVLPATPVVVRLATNPSTGFRWKLLVPLDARILRLVSHRYQAPPAGSALGAAGLDVWRFVTVGRGRASLRLGYLRPWQPQQVAKRFRVDFRVS